MPTVGSRASQMQLTCRKSATATIYRTVTTVADQRALHALTIDGGTTTYGLATAPHHHAVCTQCGAIIEVPARQLSSALQHAMAGS